MKMSRRSVLASTAGAVTLTAADALAAVPKPNDLIAATRALDLKGLPSRDQLWEWLLWMNNLGPKLTGNPAHIEFVNFLAREMTAIPGMEVVRETYSFGDGGKWDAKHCAIQLIEGGKARAIPVTSYFPYSGQTRPAGITADVVYGGKTPDYIKGDTKGKILLLDAPVLPVMYHEWYTLWGSFEPGLEMPNGLTEAINQQYCAPDLKQFKDQGAVGVILAWNGVPDVDAKDQYIPFSKARHDIPALWVGEKSGAEIKAAIARGAKVTLTLDAAIDTKATSDGIFATLPGMSDETIIVVTHTDGGNATEENGGIGLLAIAKHMAALPKAQRRRTYKFIFTTGHMAGPQVPMMRTFADNHKDMLGKAVAALSVEHLGSREWARDNTGGYVPTGKNCITWAITDRKVLADLLLASLEGTAADRTLVVKPIGNQFKGEGATFFRNGIATLGFLPVPEYLLTAPQTGEIEKMDSALFYAQTVALTRVARHLDTVDRNSLAAVVHD